MENFSNLFFPVKKMQKIKKKKRQGLTHILWKRYVLKFILSYWNQVLQNIIESDKFSTAENKIKNV